MWGRKRPADFNAVKSQPVFFSRKKSVVDMKMDESAFDGKSSFHMLGFYFSSKLSYSPYIASIELYLYKFLKRLCIEHFCHVWLVLLTSSCIC